MTEKNERAMRECGQVATKLANLIERLKKDSVELDELAIAWTMLGSVMAVLRDQGASAADVLAATEQIVGTIFSVAPLDEDEEEEHDAEARRH